MKFLFFWGGVFSQWYSCKFSEFGLEFNCAEQFMMAGKAKLFKDEEIFEKIMNSASPREQKKLGRKVKNFDVDSWNAVARDVVTLGNYNKFTQNADLLNELISNKDKEFVEASPYDTLWGIGLSYEETDKSKWKGKNWLGQCINDTITHINNETIDKVKDNVKKFWR
jgi:ribA/ribD-fused uncharacterized protein